MTNKRGRKSAAELSVVGLAEVERETRPDAPYDLTDEQAEEWRGVVEAMPADWFPREVHGLLTQYCRHIVAGRRIAQLVAACEAGSDGGLDLEEYDKLLKMQEREGRAASSLATRLRITTQATVRAEGAKKPKKRRAPWES